MYGKPSIRLLPYEHRNVKTLISDEHMDIIREVTRLAWYVARLTYIFSQFIPI